VTSFDDLLRHGALFKQLMAAMYDRDHAKIADLVAKLSEHRAPLISMVGTMCEMILEEQVPDWEERKARGQVMMPKFLHFATEQIKDSDEVPTHVARAGQMVAAVGNGDDSMFIALFEACAAGGEDLLSLTVTQIVASATHALNVMRERE